MESIKIQVLNLNSTASGDAGEAFFAYNQVVLQRYANQVGCFLDFLGAVQVLLAGFGVAAGMVVDHDQGRCIRPNRQAHDFSRLNDHG